MQLREHELRQTRREFRAGPRRAPIVVSAEQIRQLQAAFARQEGRQPAPDQLRALIQEVVDNELLYREARQLQLSFQDRSIRMRLVQKMRAVSAHPAQDEDVLYREALQLGLDDDLVIQRVLRQKMSHRFHEFTEKHPSVSVSFLNS